MKENKEAFLDQEPSDGHFERFEQRLKTQKRKVRIIRLSKSISKVAAIGLLAIMSSLWAYNEFISPKEQGMSLSDISPDYQEVEFFFTSQINSKYQDILNNEILDDSEYKKNLNQEMIRMDSLYNELKLELGENPNDERIIQAMIRHYQTKLQVMSDILEQLNKIKQDDKLHTNNQNQYESVKL